MQKNSTKKIEQTILKISFSMGLIFAVAEFASAIWAYSNSMLMDAVYDFSELIVTALTIFLMPLFYKPLTEKRPFGYAQVESVFIVIKNLIMLSVTVGLLRDTIQVMLGGGNSVNSAFVAKFQLALGCTSFIVLLVMKKINHKIISPIINTEIYGWKIDIYYSLGMSAAFFLATLLKGSKLTPILPYFDQIVAIIIVLCMMPQAIKMLITSLKNMFLFAPNEAISNTVNNIAFEVLDTYDYNIVTCDIYRTGRILWADIYITTQQETLLTEEFSKASLQLQTLLKKELEDCQSQLILTPSVEKEVAEQ